MNENERTEGNPETMNEQQVAEDTVFGSPDSFFEALEDQVNGAISEDAGDTEQVTPQQEGSNDAESEVQQVSEDSENYKKRYSDSSREAGKLKAELNELKPFVPVLEAMKKDSGLVDYVREYFTKGGNVPDNVKEQLKLNEDFEMDMDDAINNPDSSSKKVFNTMVDNVVKKRINETLDSEREKAEQFRQQISARKQAEEFMKKNGLTQEEFANFLQESKEHYDKNGMTYDDMYYLMNRDKTNANVANSAKKDMLNQMKNVRSIPTSQSNANSSKTSKDPNDNLFDSLLGLDEGIDTLFG
jgi:hypothetical protein